MRGKRSVGRKNCEFFYSRPRKTLQRTAILLYTNSKRQKFRRIYDKKQLYLIWTGVIIDSEMEYLKYIYEFAKEKNPDILIEDLYGTVGTTKRDCWIVVEKAVDNGESWEELRQQYRSRWDEVFELVDYQAIFRPEVLTVMDWIRERGFKLAVASSTNIEQVTKILTMNHVAERLELMVSGGMFKRSKPDPEIYFYTAEKTGG